MHGINHQMLNRNLTKTWYSRCDHTNLIIFFINPFKIVKVSIVRFKKLKMCYLKTLNLPNNNLFCINIITVLFI